MTKKERIIGALATVLLAVSAFVCDYFLYNAGVGSLQTTIISCAVLALCFISFYGVFMNCEIAFKGGFIGFIITVILLLAYIAALKYGWLSLFSDKQAMQRFISRYDGYAIAVFVIVQFLQVTVLPLPSTITTLAGIALFGVWKTVLYSSIGIIAGSMFAFFLGRVFGVKLVIWICGAKMFEKYRRLTEGKDVLLLYAMFLLPFFPDDLLCLIAGLGTMSYRSFFVMMLITRPLGALWVAGVFKGAVSIPFSGWGIAVWAVIAIATVSIFVTLYRYGDEITARLSVLSGKIANRLHFSRNRIKEKKTSLKARKKRLASIYSTHTAQSEIDKKALKNKNLTDYRN